MPPSCRLPSRAFSALLLVLACAQPAAASMDHPPTPPSVAAGTTSRSFLRFMRPARTPAEPSHVPHAEPGPHGQPAPHGGQPVHVEAQRPPAAPSAIHPKSSRTFTLGDDGTVHKGAFWHVQVSAGVTAWNRLSARQPQVARQVRKALEGVELVVDRTPPTPDDIAALRRVNRSIVHGQGEESDIAFERMLDGEAPVQPITLEEAQRVYGEDVTWEQAKAKFQGDVKQVLTAIARGVRIRPAHAEGLTGDQHDAVAALNAHLDDEHTLFARTHFRLDLNPGAQKKRRNAVIGAGIIGAIATGADLGFTAAGHPMIGKGLGTFLSVGGDDTLNSGGEIIEGVHNGIPFRRMMSKQKGTFIALAATVPMTEGMSYANEMWGDAAAVQVGAAGAFGGLVVFAAAKSTATHISQQVEADREARGAGVYGLQGKLQVESGFQSEMLDIIGQAHPPEVTKQALVKLLARHAGADNASEVESLIAKHPSLDDLVKAVRDPGAKREWMTMMKASVQSSPARAGNLAALPVATVGGALVNLKTHGHALDSTVTQAILSATETVLSYVALKTARPVARGRYGWGSRQIAKQAVREYKATEKARQATARDRREASRAAALSDAQGYSDGR